MLMHHLCPSYANTLPHALHFCATSLRSPLPQGAVEGELDPEDDPNNQGEDEFEEAEDERPQHRLTEEEEEVVEEEEEPAAPAQHVDTHPHPGQPAVEEELVVSKGPENGSAAFRLQRLQQEKDWRCGWEREAVQGVMIKLTGNIQGG